MADLTFNTPAGQTIPRNMLVSYLETETDGVAEWSPIGKRVEDSTEEFEWEEENSKDILGDTYIRLKKPTITQSFDPWELDSGDKAQKKIWNLAIREQNAQALSNQRMLIVHLYAGQDNTVAFAERYEACKVINTSLGGEGGGNIGMSIEVTYGGTRTVGAASVVDGKVTFTPDVEV